LDQINAKKLAKPFGSKSLALTIQVQTVWPVFLSYTTK